MWNSLIDYFHLVSVIKHRHSITLLIDQEVPCIELVTKANHSNGLPQKPTTNIDKRNCFVKGNVKEAVS